MPPLWALALASQLRADVPSVKVDILDEQLLGRTALLKKISAGRYDLAGFSPVAYTYLDTDVRDPLAGSDNGRPLTNSPAHVVTGGMTWTPQLSDYVAGLLHIDFRMQGDSTPLNEPIAQPFVANDGHEIVNARVGLTFNDRYSIEGYVENLFNTYYNITAFPIPEQGASFAVYPSAPRFYGLRVRASF